ncbi:L-2-hydroxyglutarate oxidase LhgO (plasmid) [Sulfitobacter sp. THAF37]|uniref:NAD(P)/FAD-dependent oxidoreductase n=1 Tax=Sulfitobacter sp. THAF37 TaxID=2587855 RepID=UPI001268027A|nr:FAD-dependent oxidoreductase [Sulfitobacter sp. THAF37]QFT61155.1 L-2-hydroxyglutarate oxidase LhgO [Sulfitobacter sp. THAF37]
MPGQRQSVDAIVIGAGIAGASVAAHLAASLRVFVLEMENQPGYHTTGRSAAVFAPSYGPDGVRALTRASRPFFDNTPADFATASLFSPRDILMIAREDQLDALDALIASVSDGTLVEKLAAPRLQDHQPLLRSGYAAAGMLDRGGQDIDVAALHQGYLRLLRARGGRVITNAAVEGLSRQGGDWVIETRTSGTLTAGIVVNAAGAWADRIGRLAGAEDIGLVPKRRTAMVVAEPANFTRRDAPITVDVEEDFYLKPDAGRLLISPADETPTVPCDAQPDEMDVAICADRIMTAFNLDIRRIENKWAGLRSFVADKEPVIGYSGVADGFFWMAGQGGYGIQSAPAAAEVAASMILGKPLPSGTVDAGFDPSRVAPGRLAVAA